MHASASKHIQITIWISCLRKKESLDRIKRNPGFLLLTNQSLRICQLHHQFQCFNCSWISR
jgi:hypothetical protein